MAQPSRCIVVLGAAGTGAAELTRHLSLVLAASASWRLSLDTEPSAQHDFALLMGLDLPCIGPVDPGAREREDSRLRQRLHALDLPYRVVYGAGRARLTNGLLALGLAVPDVSVQQTRIDAQFELNRGRTPWSCEKCSDPACEHKLFTGLLGQTSGALPP